MTSEKTYKGYQSLFAFLGFTALMIFLGAALSAFLIVHHIEAFCMGVI